MTNLISGAMPTRRVSQRQEAEITVPPRRDSLLDIFMRMSTFQMASRDESWLMRLIFDYRWNQVNQVKCCSKKGAYDPERCQESERVLINLGGEKFSRIPLDKEAVIQGLYFDPAKMKAKITSLSGEWKKIKRKGKYYFAILPPAKKTQEWNDFYTNTLQKMPWAAAGWDRNIIITAEDVKDAPEIGENNKCVFLVEATVPAPMHRKEIGRFLGLGSHVAISNARGIAVDPNEKTAENGVITEASCYADVACVLDYLHKNKKIPKSDVILRGNCLNASIAMAVVAKFAAQGLNAFLDNLPISPRQMIARDTPEIETPKGLFATAMQKVGQYVKKSMISFYDAHIHATQSLPESPLRKWGIQENGFNITERIEKMRKVRLNSGTVLLTATEGDDATPSDEVKTISELLKDKLSTGRSLFYYQKKKEIPKGQHPHMASTIQNHRVQSHFIRHFLNKKTSN